MNQVTVSAPGKLMVMGEYAVLHGYPCITAAVDRRMYAFVKKRNDDLIKISSDKFGVFETKISDILKTNYTDFEKNFKFVLGSLKKFYESNSKKSKGFDIKIKSDFSSKVGFGSSAASTVAVNFAVNYLNGQSTEKKDIFEQSYSTVWSVQGKLGSGFDVAASTYGGIFLYKKGQGVLEEIGTKDLMINAVYCGYKTPTVEMVKMVRDLEKKSPEKYKNLYLEIEKITKKTFDFLKKNEMEEVGKLMNENQKLLEDLGVSDEASEYLISKLKKISGIFGVKISGAGKGDCVIGLSRKKIDKIEKYETFNLKIDEGVRVENVF